MTDHVQKCGNVWYYVVTYNTVHPTEQIYFEICVYKYILAAMQKDLHMQMVFRVAKNVNQNH